MSNFNNNNKSAWNSSSNSYNISSNTPKNIDASDWNSLSNKWYNSLNPSKNIHEHGKQSFLEDDSVKNIGTRPPIRCNKSPISQNIVIQNNKNSGKTDQTMIGKIIENTITCTINHNLGYRNTVSSILMIEEFNNFPTKTVMMGTKGYNIALFVVEYPHLKNKQYQLFH